MRVWLLWRAWFTEALGMCWSESVFSWRCVKGKLCPLWLKIWSVCRRDKLWISMEYCGGGSLQDIYHGNGHKTFRIFLFNHDFCMNHSSSFPPPVTGPLSESQIAYMSRETMQVRCGTHFLTFGLWMPASVCEVRRETPLSFLSSRGRSRLKNECSFK